MFCRFCGCILHGILRDSLNYVRPDVKVCRTRGGPMQNLVHSFTYGRSSSVLQSSILIHVDISLMAQIANVCPWTFLLARSSDVSWRFRYRCSNDGKRIICTKARLHLCVYFCVCDMFMCVLQLWTYFLSLYIHSYECPQGICGKNVFDKT